MFASGKTCTATQKLTLLRFLKRSRYSLGILFTAPIGVLFIETLDFVLNAGGIHDVLLSVIYGLLPPTLWFFLFLRSYWRHVHWLENHYFNDDTIILNTTRLVLTGIIYALHSILIFVPYWLWETLYCVGGIGCLVFPVTLLFAGLGVVVLQIALIVLFRRMRKDALKQHFTKL